MSVGQEHDSSADDPDLIRLNKRSLFTPSASVAVEQHSAVPHVSRSTYGTAKVEGKLTSPNARVPEIITQRCGGITVRVIRSNRSPIPPMRSLSATRTRTPSSRYPFTGEPVITQALLTVAQMPLFVGVGGGTTTGPRVAELAMVAEMQGAAGVVINAPAPAETIETTMSMVDIPVIATVTEDDENHRMQDSCRCGHHQCGSRCKNRASRGKASARIIRKSRFWLRAEVVKTVFSPPLMRAPTRSHGRPPSAQTTAVADDGQIPWRV